MIGPIQESEPKLFHYGVNLEKRTIEIYERVGIELDRSTLADWVGGASSTPLRIEELLPCNLGLDPSNQSDAN